MKALFIDSQNLGKEVHQKKLMIFQKGFTLDLLLADSMSVLETLMETSFVFLFLICRFCVCVYLHASFLVEQSLMEPN